MNAKLSFILLLLISTKSFAVIEVGESIPNLCWRDNQEKTVCLDDFKENVRILVYTTGWCDYAKTYIEKLVGAIGEFETKPVTFINPSAQGWTTGSAPTIQFLNEWKTKYKIPFIVAASPLDAGKNFFSLISVPNVAVMDREGKLAYKEIAPDFRILFDEIRKALK